MKKTSGPAHLGGALVAAVVMLTTAQSLNGQVVAISELHPLSPDGSVDIEVVTHDLLIEAWDRNEIEIVGEYDSSVEELEIETGGGSFTLELDLTQRTRNQRLEGDRELTIRLPAGVELSAESVSGDVTASSLTGQVSAASVSGAVRLDADAESVSLRSVSGSVSFEGAASTVHLTSVSGSVRYTGDAEEAELESVSGRIEVEGGTALLDVEAVSGRTTVSSTVPVESLSMESVSGGLSFTGALAPGGTINADTFSGSVALTLSPDAEARFELETFTGSIDSEFPGATDEVRRESRFTPSESLSFVTGSGQGRVDVSSHSGRIRIRTP